MKVTRRTPDQPCDSLHARCSVAGRPFVGEALVDYLTARAEAGLRAKTECPLTILARSMGGPAGATGGGQNMRERVG